MLMFCETGRSTESHRNSLHFGHHIRSTRCHLTPAMHQASRWVPGIQSGAWLRCLEEAIPTSRI